MGLAPYKQRAVFTCCVSTRLQRDEPSRRASRYRVSGIFADGMVAGAPYRLGVICCGWLSIRNDEYE